MNGPPLGDWYCSCWGPRYHVMPVDNDMERLRRIERAAQSVCAIRVSHKTAAEKQALDRLAEVLNQ
jgi:hypothetical protein